MKGLPPSLKHLVTGKASGEAKHLTMNLIQKHKSVTTQNLFEFVKSRNAANGITESPIRSLRHLKKVVLNDLENAGKVTKVHYREPLTAEEAAELAAKTVDSRSKGQPQQKKPPPTHRSVWRWEIPVRKVPAEKKEIFGKEVGVGEDWSHLNKRRQRKREEKVERDVAWLKELEEARKEVMAEMSS